MPLSNLVYTAGQAPNLVGPGLQVVGMRPNPYEAFSKGYDDQQKRELALQQYREAKLKADLATALYPLQSRYQQAILQARLDALTNPPAGYATRPSPNTGVATPTGTDDGTGDHGPLTTEGAHDAVPASPAPYPYQILPNPLQLAPSPSGPAAFGSGSFLPAAPNTTIPTADASDYSFNPLETYAA